MHHSSNQKIDPFQEYRFALKGAQMGSLFGSGIIVGLSSTITLWQKAMNLSDLQVGSVSALLMLAIAIGSLGAGTLGNKFGLKKCFLFLLPVCFLGALICALSFHFFFLCLGVAICGVASGADLAISLSVLSTLARDEKISARLVSSTQVYWSLGCLLTTLLAFITSTLSGAWSGRLEMIFLMGMAALGAMYRRRAIVEGPIQLPENDPNEARQKPSLKKLFGSGSKINYRALFGCILFFYCASNLLANTFGQFQTFLLVKADASQSFATGINVVLGVGSLLIAQGFSKIAADRMRNGLFGFGIVIMVAALLIMASAQSALWIIVVGLALYNFGSMMAGESLMKVWTQESFPQKYRSSIQGLIVGVSRLFCAAFAVVTPALVVPSAISATMIGFAVLIVLAGLAGFEQMHLQKKYHLGALKENN